MHFKNRPGFVMLDGKKLYASVLAVRQMLGCTWTQVEEASGVSIVSLKRLKRGRSVEATTFLRLVIWLGQTRVHMFTRVVTEEEGGDHGDG